MWSRQETKATMCVICFKIVPVNAVPVICFRFAVLARRIARVQAFVSRRGPVFIIVLYSILFTQSIQLIQEHATQLTLYMYFSCACVKSCKYCSHRSAGWDHRPIYIKVLPVLRETHAAIPSSADDMVSHSQTRGGMFAFVNQGL